MEVVPYLLSFSVVPIIEVVRIYPTKTRIGFRQPLPEYPV